jgi:GWxTD domain-containing protein
VVLKNNKIIIGVILYLFSANIMISYSQQDKPLVSTGNIQFYLDKAVFSGKENKSFVEFYLMFFADQIKYYGDKGELQVEATITDKNGNVVLKNKEWEIEVNLPQKESLKTKVIYDQWNDYLIPGEYKIQMQVNDAYNKRTKGVINGLMNIPELLSDKIHSSEIEFVSSTANDTSVIQFQKGNRNVIPNPSRRFGIFNPALSIYYELYNIGSKGTLQINYAIYDKDNKEVKSEQSNMDKPGKTAAILKGIDISNLKSGIYDLHIKVLDSLSNDNINLSRSFEIIQGDFITNIKSLSEDLIKTYTAILSYIASPGQLETFKKLNPIGKGEYLIQFWKSKDPTPGTPENEYLENIQKRFAYAAKNFGWSSIKGWETDMGRVCIKYGMPDEVQQFNSEANSQPYQIWKYKEDREFHFVFGDLQGDGRFTLLDSDKEGEISNSQWRSLVNKM